MDYSDKELDDSDEDELSKEDEQEAMAISTDGEKELDLSDFLTQDEQV